MVDINIDGQLHRNVTRRVHIIQTEPLVGVLRYVAEDGTVLHASVDVMDVATSKAGAEDE